MDCAVTTEPNRHLRIVDREDAFEEWLDWKLDQRVDALQAMGLADLCAALFNLVGGIPEFDALFDTSGEPLACAEPSIRAWINREETTERIKSITRGTH